jgi:hypothetical protein
MAFESRNVFLVWPISQSTNSLGRVGGIARVSLTVR